MKEILEAGFPIRSGKTGGGFLPSQERQRGYSFIANLKLYPYKGENKNILVFGSLCFEF